VKVYISGPITGIPDFGRSFEKAAARLAEHGHEPVNPAAALPPCGDTCGEVKGRHSWSCYMRNDLQLLLDCDAILMLDGWERSHGARLELYVATACGLIVLHTTSDKETT
jgi:hypothetical protein